MAAVTIERSALMVSLILRSHLPYKTWCIKSTKFIDLGDVSKRKRNVLDINESKLSALFHG